MKINTLKIYFVFLFVISLLWSIFVLNSYRGYGLLVIPVLGFPYFVFNYFTKLSSLSLILKKEYPDIFRKIAMHYGFHKDELINATLLFGNDDFKSIQNKEILELLHQSKLSIKLCFLSIISPVAIIFIAGLFK